MSIGNMIHNIVNNPIATERTVVPIGKYAGVMVPLNDKSFQGGDKDDGTQWCKFKTGVKIVSDDPEVSGQIVYTDMWLDVEVDDEGKTVLVEGKNRNIDFGRLLAFLNLNHQGAQYTDMKDQDVVILVKHDSYENDLDETITKAVADFVYE